MVKTESFKTAFRPSSYNVTQFLLQICHVCNVNHFGSHLDDYGVTIDEHLEINYKKTRESAQEHNVE